MYSTLWYTPGAWVEVGSKGGRGGGDGNPEVTALRAESAVIDLLVADLAGVKRINWVWLDDLSLCRRGDDKSEMRRWRNGGKAISRTTALREAKFAEETTENWRSGGRGGEAWATRRVRYFFSFSYSPLSADQSHKQPRILRVER